MCLLMLWWHKDEGINMHGIDPQSQNTKCPVSEEFQKMSSCTSWKSGLEITILWLILWGLCKILFEKE